MIFISVINKSFNLGSTNLDFYTYFIAKISLLRSSYAFHTFFFFSKNYLHFRKKNLIPVPNWPPPIDSAKT